MTGKVGEKPALCQLSLLVRPVGRTVARECCFFVRGHFYREAANDAGGGGLMTRGAFRKRRFFVPGFLCVRTQCGPYGRSGRGPGQPGRLQ